MAAGRGTSNLRSGRWLPPMLASTVIIATAFVLWLVSDRLIWIGPLDRAAFGWAIVIPLWWMAPIVGGLLAADLDRGGQRIAATALFFVLAVGATIALLGETAFPDCEFGTHGEPLTYALRVPMVGALIGVGPPAVLLASAVARRRGGRVRAVAAGLAVGVVVTFATIVAAVSILSAPVCNRPPA